MSRVTLMKTNDPALAALSPSQVDRSALTKGKAIVGTPTFSQASTSFRGGHRSMVNTGDYVEYDELLKAGTWALTVETVTAASGGTFEVRIDGVLVGTIDTYLVSGGAATRTELTGVVIAATGTHTIRLVVIAKNAASSANTCRISGYSMTRTGA